MNCQKIITIYWLDWTIKNIFFVMIKSLKKLIEKRQ